jgi:AsmA protein
MDAASGRRLGKILGLLVGAILALFAVALVAVWALINPNDYKGRIAQAVKDSTGRNLTLQGDIKLSLFPWVALEFGPAELGNPREPAGGSFGDAPFLVIGHAAVRARLWPLLHRRLSIGRIDVDGLDVHLQRNAAGMGNWEGFGGASTTHTDGRSESPKARATPSQSADRLEGLDGIRIQHGRLSYQDLVVDKISLETGRFTDGTAVPVALAFELQRGANGALGVIAKMNLSTDFNAQKYDMAAVDVNGTMDFDQSGRSVTWRITAPSLALDLDADTLVLPAFAAQFAAARVTGALQASHVVGGSAGGSSDSPTVTGSINVAPFDLREMLARVDVPNPQTRDPKALTQIAAAAEFSYGANAARLGPLELTLDDTHIRGEAAFKTTDGHRALTFDLAADRIDVDRYLGPNKPEKPVPTPAAVKPAKKADPPEASGRLAVGALTIVGVAVSNLKVTVASNGGVTHLYPSTADLYGGHYSGNITLDQSGAVPAVSMDEHLQGIDMAQLLADRLKSKRLSGHGNVDIKASARGEGSEAMFRSATGHVDASLVQGALEGVDIGYQIGQAQALLDKTPLPQTQNTGRTRFDSFKASATLGNGMATIKDLNIASPYLHVTGGGNANLISQALDLRVLASILKSPAGAATVVSLLDIPVLITGDASDPKVRLDLEGLAKSQLKQKLQDVLKDKLQGLFGK